MLANIEEDMALIDTLRDYHTSYMTDADIKNIKASAEGGPAHDPLLREKFRLIHDTQISFDRLNRYDRLAEQYNDLLQKVKEKDKAYKSLVVKYETLVQDFMGVIQNPAKLSNESPGPKSRSRSPGRADGVPRHSSKKRRSPGQDYMDIEEVGEGDEDDYGARIAHRHVPGRNLPSHRDEARRRDVQDLNHVDLSEIDKRIDAPPDSSIDGVNDLVGGTAGVNAKNYPRTNGAGNFGNTPNARPVEGRMALRPATDTEEFPEDIYEIGKTKPATPPPPTKTPAETVNMGSMVASSQPKNLLLNENRNEQPPSKTTPPPPPPQTQPPKTNVNVPAPPPNLNSSTGEVTAPNPPAPPPKKVEPNTTQPQQIPPPPQDPVGLSLKEKQPLPSKEAPPAPPTMPPPPPLQPSPVKPAATKPGNETTATVQPPAKIPSATATPGKISPPGATTPKPVAEPPQDKPSPSSPFGAKLPLKAPTETTKPANPPATDAPTKPLGGGIGNLKSSQPASANDSYMFSNKSLNQPAAPPNPPALKPAGTTTPAQPPPPPADTAPKNPFGASALKPATPLKTPSPPPANDSFNFSNKSGPNASNLKPAIPPPPPNIPPPPPLSKLGTAVPPPPPVTKPANKDDSLNFASPVGSQNNADSYNFGSVQGNSKEHQSNNSYLNNSFLNQSKDKDKGANQPKVDQNDSYL